MSSNNYKIWAQNVLPIVFDDYLQQKDLIIKLVQYVNGLVGDAVTLNNDFEAIDSETIGDLEDLHTTAKDSIVDAINEVEDDVEDLKTEKLDAPEIAGTSGQVLVSDGEGGQVWADVDSTLTISGAAADAKATGDEISSLKTDITNIEDGLAARVGDPEYSKTLTGTIIPIEDRDINSVEMSDTNALIFPVNFWRYKQTTANADMSSYNSHFTVSVENNGYKIVKDTFSTGSRFTTNWIEMPLDGYLYASCDAHTTHPTNLCRINLSLSSSPNASLAEDSKGSGHLMVGAYVHAGDKVILQCYAGASDEIENTWYYENIMLSYSPTAKYEPFSGKSSNYSKVVEMSEYTGVTNTVNPNTAIYGGYRVNYSSLFDTPYLPSANTAIPYDIIIKTRTPNAIKVVPYEDVYNARENNIIGISTSGTISIYHNGDGATAMKEWVKSIELQIIYIPTTGTYTGSEKAYTFRSGNVIKYSSSSTLKYKTSTATKRKCLCFGDSITGMFDNGGGYVGVLNYINDDVEFVNCGFSGCRWTDHADSAYMPFSMNRLTEAIVSGSFTLQDASAKVDPESASYNRLFALHLNNIKNADFKQVSCITIFYGTNDFGSGAKVNSSDDTSTTNKQRTNVEDAVKYTIEQLLTAYPNLTIVLVTPYWSYILGSNSNTTPNGIGKYLIDYCNKIESVGHEYNMPVLNLYNNLGVTMQNKAGYLLDNAHPNYTLSKMIANRINAIVGEYN